MKRLALMLTLILLLSFTTAASAMIASLEDALSPLLAGRDKVSMAVSMDVKKLLPFNDTKMDLFNRVLQHLQLRAVLDANAMDADTSFQLVMDDDVLFEVSELYMEDTYIMQTSLLPNRMLLSAQSSPMDMLLLSGEEETVEAEESKDPNTSDVAEAFDFLSAIDEMQACYRDLIDKTMLLTERNKVSYTIDNIGKGRYSYVAKLTTDQSTELLSELRGLLSCGMDAPYREELSQITFGRSFTVALYQNADEEDISVYIKGTILYPDGDERSLKWQWSFTPDGETQTFIYRVSRESGRRDTRNVDAILTREDTKSGFKLEGETEANLRRGGRNETSTLTIDINIEEGDTATCTGAVKRATGGTDGDNKLDETVTEVTVDLTLAGQGAVSELTGTASYQEAINDTVFTEIGLTFAQPPAVIVQDEPADEPADTAAEDTESSPVVEISIMPADTAAAQQSAITPTVTVEETETVQPEFLVGTAPIGLYDYEIPDDMMSIDMDATAQKVHQSLMNEAAQRLAGNLIIAILNLPPEDRLLLSDGMTEMDYTIFLAMLE